MTDQPNRSSAPQPLAVDPTLSSRHPFSILMVDDEAMNRLLTAKIFSKMGYRVDLAESAGQAIEAISRKAYDFLFTDLMLEEGDSVDAMPDYRKADQCWAESRGHELVVIALTGKTSSADRDRCLAAGMQEYLCKPVRPEMLQQILVTWAERWQSNPSA